MRTDISQYHLNCPFCFVGFVAVIHDNATPHTGDYFCCPACFGVGVLRSRTMYRAGWTVVKPHWRDRLKIANHEGVSVILRKYEIAQFGNGVSAL